MPNPTVTLRSVKNKDTGLDLTITSIKEIPGLLSYTLEYSIIVVSNLPCFKLLHHKETDTVQFVVVKKYEDFERFHENLSREFPRTTKIPPMSKTSLSSLFELATFEKHSAVEELLKFVASTPIVATSHVTLEFLGINPLSAGKFRVNKQASTHGGEGNSKGDSVSESSKAHRVDLFADVDDEPDNLFGDTSSETPESNRLDLLSSVPPHRTSSRSKDTFLFAEQNLDTEGISADSSDLFIFPGAKVEGRHNVETEPDDDLSDLLTIDDGIEKLLRRTSKEADRSDNTLITEESSATRTAIRSSSSGKPALPSKPKPALPPKPSSAKPLSPAQSKPADVSSIDGTNLNVTDIMKYIKQNLASEDAEPDLFT